MGIEIVNIYEREVVSWLLVTFERTARFASKTSCIRLYVIILKWIATRLIKGYRAINEVSKPLL